MDGFFILLTLASIGYLFINYEYIITRYALVHPLSGSDMVFGILLAALLIEASRRAIGPALPITAGCFLVYAYLGPYLPGLLRHSGFTTETIVDQLYLYDRRNLRHAFGRLGHLCHSLYHLRNVPGKIRNRPALHGFRFGHHGMDPGRTGKNLLHLQRPVRNHLRQRRGQRDGGWMADHPLDEAHRIQAPVRLRRGSCRLHRRPDHAAGHGRGRFRHGRIHRDPLHYDLSLCDDPGPPLLFGPFYVHPFRGREMGLKGIPKEELPSAEESPWLPGDTCLSPWASLFT